jgi:uncharacterized protein involved in exopolysaccharide biosynthesis
MADYEREVELIDYIEVVLKRKWLILLGTLACMVGGMLHGRSAPRLYEASALLFVSDANRQRSAQADSEVETPGLDVNFYRIVATADEIKLAMNEYRDHLVDSLGIETAGISLSANVVDKTGIRLTATSRARQLAVPIVHAWTDTFLARTAGLTATESGRYLEFVNGQRDVYGAKLATADAALENFEKEQRIVFLEQRRVAFEEQIAILQSDAIRTGIELRQMESELTRTRLTVAELEIDATPVFLLEAEAIDRLNRDSLPPMARQAVDNLARILIVGQMRRDAAHELENSLLNFDRNRGYTRLAQKAEQLRRAILEYAEESRGAEESRISALVQIEGLERELLKHKPVIAVARAIADDDLLEKVSGGASSEKAIRKLERLKLYSELPNPVYQALDEQLAAEGARWEIALSHLNRGQDELAGLQDRLFDIQQEFLALEKERQSLVEASEQRGDELDDQLRALGRIHLISKQHYQSSKSREAELSPQVLELRSELRDRQAQLSSVEASAFQTLDQLKRLLARRERLARAKETMVGIFERFAKRAEEAGIAREKATSGLRKITMARTPKMKSAVIQSRLQKSLVSGAVGLVASIFLAFLLEYVHKARALRDAA